MTARLPLVSAVLFDVDGTLLDTEAYIFGAFSAALAQAGAAPQPVARYRAVVGHPLEQCYEALAPGHDTASLCAFHRRWQAARLEMVRPMPGAADLLSALRQRGVRLAAVTNRSRQSSIDSLARVGLLASLETVVSSEDVARQKPDPEPVRLALGRLAVAPANGVMVGDTVADVEAGRAAGARTIGIAAGFGGRALAASTPDAFVPALPDVLAVLLQWGTGHSRQDGGLQGRTDRDTMTGE